MNRNSNRDGYHCRTTGVWDIDNMIDRMSRLNKCHSQANTYLSINYDWYVTFNLYLFVTQPKTKACFFLICLVICYLYLSYTIYLVTFLHNLFLITILLNLSIYYSYSIWIFWSIANCFIFLVLNLISYLLIVTFFNKCYFSYFQNPEFSYLLIIFNIDSLTKS